MKKPSDLMSIWQSPIFKTPYTAALVTSLLVATSYPPFYAWALFFCVVPLWRAWAKAPDGKTVFLAGFVSQFFFVLIGFNWIAHTAVEYGHLPVIVSIFILLGFCCISSLHIPVAGWLAYKINKRWPLSPGWFFVLIACLTAAGEWFYPMIFPWNFGYPLLFSHFRTSQLAEFVGFNFLSFGVLLANAAFATALNNYPKRRWSMPVLIFIFMLFGTEMLGLWAEKNLEKEDRILRVLLVQPNIGNYDKFMAERGSGFQGPVVEKDFSLTEQGLKVLPIPPDLIVWPETAYPVSLDPPFKDGFYQSKIFAFAKQNNVPMLVGAYSEEEGGAGNRAYNAVFFIDEKGQSGPGYRKSILLAFGEYFPGAQWFPALKKIVPEISDFGRGTGPVVFQSKNASFSPLICYEGLDVPYVTKAAKLGGQIFVNVTNDSWFGKKFEPYQHMIMTIARTIEFRRPMIRSTNTGFTVVADARGHIRQQSPQDVAWVDTATVPYASNPKTTLFSRIADYISLIYSILLFLVVILGRYVVQRT